MIYVWQAMEQIFGTRWNDKFGNDPLGKYKDSDGNQNPRMEMWIELVKYASWPAVKGACAKVRDMPKPKDDQWWLPDGQVFSSILRATAAVMDYSRPSEQRVIRTWPELACNTYLIRLTFKHGPFSEASRTRLWEVKNQVVEQLNYLLEHGELPKEPTAKDIEEVRETLRKRFAKVQVEPPSSEETDARMRSFQQERGLIPKDP